MDMPDDFQSLKAMLEWQHDLGVTEAIGDAPVNRYEGPDNRYQGADNRYEGAERRPVQPRRLSPWHCRWPGRHLLATLPLSPAGLPVLPAIWRR